jgi:hypothetical protein
MEEVCQDYFESVQTRIARINAKEESKFSSPLPAFASAVGRGTNGENSAAWP